MPSRSQPRLYSELRTALAATKPEDLRAWGTNSAKRLPMIAARRVKNLGRLAGRIVGGTAKEIAGAWESLRQGRFGPHLGDRVAAGIDGSIAVAKQTTSAIAAVGSALLNNPRKSAPDVFALALGFYAGSGGLDANGGIPDTDLALGIDWHRSVFTHSIIAGAVVEGAILAVADLAGVVCEKIPAADRDPFWDRLVEAKDRIALKLAAGTSAGIAYHLAIDGTLQEGTYHGFPGPVPQEVHDTVFIGNAVTEGMDAGHKGDSKGRRVVTAAGRAGDYAQGIIKGLLTGKRGEPNA